jgi:probable DNA metabolism protein
MLVYIYDGSFPGLLTAIYESYYRREKPEEILAQDQWQHTLFAQEVVIKTDEKKADKVYQAIKDKISGFAARNAYCVFLAEVPGAEMLIYNYLSRGWKLGAKLDFHLADEAVLQVHTVAKKVRQEAHRMLGLVRFRLLKHELYYAQIEPDHNILQMISPHFARRMADQNWMIHDVKRGLAAVYNQVEWVLTPLERPKSISLDETGLFYESLWQKYFSSIAIKSRKNLRLQRSFLPKRYWKHLVEMDESRSRFAESSVLSPQSPVKTYK